MKRMLLGIIIGLVVNVSLAATNYVSLTGSSTFPYDTWAKASTNIQFAVDAASDGDLVLVQTGRFVGVAEEVSGSMVSITNAIILQSVKGAEETTIDGAGWARRCIYINNPGAIVRGFMIELGRAMTNYGPQYFPVSCGGGVFFDGAGTVENCILKYNRAGLSGGSAFMNGGGVLRNCLIFDGQAALCGGVYCTNGGEIVNCTIVDNWTTSTNLAGGVWCVNGGDTINSIIYANSNTVGSAADVYNEGTGWSYSYSRVPASVPGEGNISGDPLFEGEYLNEFSLQLSSPCLNAGTNQGWMVGGSDLAGNPRISQSRVDMGAFELPFKYYVSVNGGHKSPFTWWKTAATNFRAAIDAAIPTAEVIVSNGTYFPAEVIGINTNLTVSSLNGRSVTVVDGGDSIPCFILDHQSAVLKGFTITGGLNTNGSGGGITLTSGTVTNCIIQNCSSSDHGGGVNVQDGILRNSEIKNCEAPKFGGGVNLSGNGLVENCIIQNNEGVWAGGGVFINGGEMRSCLITSNMTPAAPIAMAGGLRTGGGGIFSLSANGKIFNCTIADNLSSNDAGGVYDLDFGTGATTYFENTVLYFNSALSNGNNYIGGSLRFLYSCTTPAVPAPQDGGGNIFSDPLFAGGYRLTLNSPCKDSGTNMAWMVGAKDLAGNPRIFGGTVDMGAYEFIPEPCLFIIYNLLFIIYWRKLNL